MRGQGKRPSEDYDIRKNLSSIGFTDQEIDDIIYELRFWEKEYRWLESNDW